MRRCHRDDGPCRDPRTGRDGVWSHGRHGGFGALPGGRRDFTCAIAGSATHCGRPQSGRKGKSRCGCSRLSRDCRLSRSSRELRPWRLRMSDDCADARPIRPMPRIAFLYGRVATRCRARAWSSYRIAGKRLNQPATTSCRHRRGLGGRRTANGPGSRDSGPAATIPSPCSKVNGLYTTRKSRLRVLCDLSYSRRFWIGILVTYGLLANLQGLI